MERMGKYYLHWKNYFKVIKDFFEIQSIYDLGHVYINS